MKRGSGIAVKLWALAGAAVLLGGGAGMVVQRDIQAADLCSRHPRAPERAFDPIRTVEPSPIADPAPDLTWQTPPAPVRSDRDLLGYDDPALLDGALDHPPAVRVHRRHPRPVAPPPEPPLAIEDDLPPLPVDAPPPPQPLPD